MFRLAVSIGVAVLGEAQGTLAALIAVAGLALDQAQSAGWNKIRMTPAAAESSGAPGAAPGGR